MRDHQCVGNEEQENRQNPQNNVGRAGFHCRSEEFRHDNDENLGQDQIANSQLFTQRLTVGSDFGLGCSEGRIVCSCQESAPKRFIGESKSPPVPKERGKEGAPQVFFSLQASIRALFLFRWF
jgi:hypothetical protein